MHYPTTRIPLQSGLFVLLVFAAGPAGQGQARPVLKAGPGPRTSPPMLQLRSEGNAAGFLPTRAYLPASGHALTVEFLGTPGVLPRVQANPDSNAGAARKVFYEDLWPGVSLTFSLTPKENCEATYVLAAGAEVAKIRLRYNIPVRLQKDGTLSFRFSSGSVTESSPEAWQQIDGKRVSVAVSFTLDHGEIGFAVGKYDPKYAMTIDPVYPMILPPKSGRFPEDNPAPPAAVTLHKSDRRTGSRESDSGAGASQQDRGGAESLRQAVDSARCSRFTPSSHLLGCRPNGMVRRPFRSIPRREGLTPFRQEYWFVCRFHSRQGR